jgi:hypothetical protein
MNILPDGKFLATELASVSVPFSFNGRLQMKAILRMMAILHVCILDQLVLYVLLTLVWNAFSVG